MGSGSALPGKLALKIDPQILNKLYDPQQAQIAIAVSGTNGKTTTTGIIKSIFEQNGKQIICNDLGANLYYGICSAFIDASNLCGKLDSSSYVLEVDEASLAKVNQSLKPQILTVTNLFRDQLDRFGEINTTRKLISAGINENTILVLNADDPNVSTLGSTSNTKYFYSFNQGQTYELSREETELKIDNEQLIKAELIQENFDSSKVGIHLPDGHKLEVEINLAGSYNIYNALAAVATAYAYQQNNGVELNWEQVVKAVSLYSGNFGRAKSKTLQGKNTITFLIKNPAGANSVLKHITKDSKAKFLIIINDNYADGQDVSWLWDADFEILANTSSIICSGIRAKDMALRLKYAGIQEPKFIEDIGLALQASLDSIEPDEKLYILPTYTSLLQLEKLDLSQNTQ